MRTPALLPLLLLAAVVAQGAVRGSIPLGLDAYRPIPEDNPLTPEKIALGRKLFFDRRLSRDLSISCATCHVPKRAFTDGRPVAVGVFGRKGTRSAPTLVNRAYGASHFWDGRMPTLEQQVLKPIQDPNEMDMTLEEVVARLRRAPATSSITSEELARALASYVRTILSGNAPIDRYLNGDREALSEEARRGLNLFRGKANCTACHVGPNFTDERFHNSGVAWRDGQWLDPGRFVVTGKEADRGAFKTPTLREIARTAPYMHDGSLATLEEVIEFYNRGGNANPYLDPELRPLNLSADEKKALLAFLQSLSGQIQEGMLN
jgi:cytochrome c peroxidase